MANLNLVYPDCGERVKQYDDETAACFACDQYLAVKNCEVV